MPEEYKKYGQNIKMMIGDAPYTLEQATLAFEKALLEVEDYCGRSADAAMANIAEDIAVIKLNRMNTEGLASQSNGGTSESYVDGYPADILKRLNRKRKIKVV